MKQSNFFILSLLSVFLLAWGCKREKVEVEFTLNNETLQPLDQPPTDLFDSLHVMRILQGDSIYFKDISTPVSAGAQRHWNFNDEMDTTGVIDFIMYPFYTPGFNKVTLCVDGEQNCATRWVYVGTPEEPVTAAVEEVPPPAIKSAPSPKPAPKVEESKPASPPVKVEDKKERPLPPPPPKEEATPPEAAFPNSGKAGIPLSKRDMTKSCIDATKTSFSVTLTPKTEVDLMSFVVYTNSCGGMDLKITGGGFSESSRYPLNFGKNQISLGDMDVRLKAGTTYTLTCTGVANYGGCASTTVPRFEDTSNCDNVSSENHPNLVLNQKNSPHIFDLKFLYR